MKSTIARPRAARRPAPAPSRRLSRRALALITGVCVTLAVLVAGGLALTGPHHTADEVASLDGHPVTRDELLFHMRRLAPTVQNELRTEYHLQGVPAWNAKVGDRTALQRLETRALAEIRRDKTTLVVAKEQGLVDSVDHADFVADLGTENQDRAEALAAGRTVYGVQRFSLEEYYTHRLTEITTSLEKRLGTGGADAPLRVTDAQVRKAFDADRDDWSAGATTYRYTQLVLPAPADAGGLQRRVTAAGSLAAVAAGEPGARLTTGTYGGSAATGLSAHDQDLVTVLGKLAPGRISAPVKGTGQVTYYQLDSKDVDEDKAFADYAQRIRQSLVEKKFDQLIQRRVDHSDLDVDTSAVDAINAEDVQQ
ncbi:peptidyl-prolyl cis-trans isomerase [Streptomyces sp. NPDC002588]|uniref:peptidyl-prolyl cis-trans isomerase n=1 Tax=Streptomyces sp. NPDC002588 TaxID=3154419 RepID=UPI00332CB618